MKPPDSAPPSGAPPPPYPAGETQVIDLADVQLSLEPSEPRLAPPPLPPEMAAAHVPSLSQPPPATVEAAPPGRSTAFYGMVLLAVLAVGIGGGIIVALSMRSAPSAGTSPGVSASGAPASITIPVVEFDDGPDGGK